MPLRIIVIKSKDEKDFQLQFEKYTTTTVINNGLISSVLRYNSIESNDDGINMEIVFNSGEKIRCDKSRNILNFGEDVKAIIVNGRDITNLWKTNKS
jgi:hypothetical protein